MSKSKHFLDQIDWHQPWLEVLQPIAVAIVQAPDWRVALNVAAAEQGLCNHRGLPLRFVQQAELPPGTAYETFISTSGGVPTRDNLHDFFNALVWLGFPRVKARLNALQAAEIAKSGAVQRGKLRDAATIFDENAALLVTRDTELVAALRTHNWREVFVTRRAAFERDCTVCLFGHALMEKLVTPYKAITAHAWVLTADAAFWTLPPQDRLVWMDAAVSRQLVQGLTTSDFTPLPVLGVPGWWPQQDAAFYADASIFRPKRRLFSAGL